MLRGIDGAIQARSNVDPTKIMTQQKRQFEALLSNGESMKLSLPQA